MSELIDRDVERALRSLSVSYAFGADRRDAELFVGVFTADAVLDVRLADTSAAHLVRGRAEIALVVERLARYPRTFHVLGQSAYTLVAPGTASGTVYCLAHHASADAEPTDTVLHVVYTDDYRDVPDVGWKITRRVVEILFETRMPAAAVRVLPPNDAEA